ncbi:MAG TPA: hypothetical protein PLS53_07925 [Thermoanaerobaculaceae bacterium]|nr:hypothetical protein [Thermoanaerobaculaceae bacterium]HPS78065.1 hypothetical protein [Thermoanaerobaculaceae bacterium]
MLDTEFREVVESLHGNFEKLMAMEPVTVDTAPAGNGTPKGGGYLFTKEGRHFYVGRTKRRIRERLKDHVSSADDCPFAWRLAREKTGKFRTYKSEGSQRGLLRDREFLAAYQEAKRQIRTMEVRYVEEPDPLRQTLLEIYVAVATSAKHNDFDAH